MSNCFIICCFCCNILILFAQFFKGMIRTYFKHSPTPPPLLDLFSSSSLSSFLPVSYPVPPPSSFLNVLYPVPPPSSFLHVFYPVSPPSSFSYLSHSPKNVFPFCIPPSFCNYRIRKDIKYLCVQNLVVKLRICA